MPAGLQILAIKPAEDVAAGAWVMRVRNPGQEAVAQVSVLGELVHLGRLPAGRIATWRISRQATKLVATPIMASELENDGRTTPA